ncbi:MAG: sulfotransferase [Chloroflexota bacterium]
MSALGVGGPRRPDTFIVGAPKSGTTSLYSYLEGHPQIYMSPVKEPLFFCTDARAVENQPTHRNDEAAYLALFADATHQLRLGEASTRYLVSRDAPELIRAFQPGAYIVAMLRNPVEMLHALHNERVSQGHEPITDFAAALAADGERRDGVPGRPEAPPLVWLYLEYARYGEQLERWYGAFGRDRVHVVVFDDFAADTPGAFRRVLDFLEIDPGYQPASFAPRNVSHRQRPLVRKLVDSRAGTWLSTDLLGRVIGANARSRLALRFRHSRLNRRMAPRPEVPAPIQRQIEEALHDDVAHLSELLGRDMVKLWFGAGAGRSP